METGVSRERRQLLGEVPYLSFPWRVSGEAQSSIWWVGWSVFAEAVTTYRVCLATNGAVEVVLFISLLADCDALLHAA